MLVSTKGQYQSFSSTVGLGDDGVLRAAWAQGYPQQVWYAPVTTAGSLATPTKLGTVPPALDRSIADLATEPLGDGRALVVWQSGSTLRLDTLTATGRLLSSHRFAGQLGALRNPGATAPSVTRFGGDGALLCWTHQSGETLIANVGVVSATGAMRVIKASTPNPNPFEGGPGSCGVAAAAGKAAIVWQGETIPQTTEEPPTQLLLQRLVPGGGLAPPVTVDTGGGIASVSSVSMTATGSVAVSWVDSLVGDAQYNLPQMVWVSADGTVGPVITLLRHAVGYRSVALEAIGPDRVVAVIGAANWLAAEEVDLAGQITAPSKVSGGGATTFRIASNGSTVLVAWQGVAPLLTPYTTEWSDGRLQTPAPVEACNNCAQLIGVSINDRGATSALVSEPNMTRLGADVAATFGP